MTLLCHISVAMQQEIYDPVKIIKPIMEFMWTTTTTKKNNSSTCDGILTNYKSFRKSVVIGEDGKHYYQNVKLKQYNKTIQHAQGYHTQTVPTICNSADE